jgi:hypothetical protein
MAAEDRRRAEVLPQLQIAILEQTQTEQGSQGEEKPLDYSPGLFALAFA